MTTRMWGSATLCVFDDAGMKDAVEMATFTFTFGSWTFVVIRAGHGNFIFPYLTHTTSPSVYVTYKHFTGGQGDATMCGPIPYQGSE